MKGKLALGILFVVVLAGLVSAFTVVPSTIELSKRTSSTSFTVNNSGGLSAVTIPSFGDMAIGSDTLSITQSATSVPPGNTTTINVSYSSLPSNLALGTFSKTITLTDGTQNSSLTLNFVSGFCDNGDNNTYNDGTKTYKLSMSIDNIDVEGFAPDDNTWYPTDEISIDIDLDNIGGNNADLENINLEVCLYDEDNNECILDEDDMDLSDNDFDLDEDDDTTITISFQLDPQDLDQPGNYVLYVKAYSDDLGEDKICLSDSEDVEVKEDDFAVLSNVKIPDTLACGDTSTITADVWNIGDDNNGEDMSIRLENKGLGIDSEVDLGDIDEWDSKKAEFDIKIPGDAEEKSHTLIFSIYDDNEDLYETDEDNDESVFYYELKVQGKCVKEVTVTKNVQITASLEPSSQEVKAGKEITIKATIKNTGEDTTTYVISLEGNDAFSQIQNINPGTLTLTSGQTQDVSITLKLNEDASGDYTFNIKALFDTQSVSQPVSLSVTGKTTITGSAVLESIKGNWFIWVIVLINVILIIAIIIVAVRISRA